MASKKTKSGTIYGIARKDQYERGVCLYVYGKKPIVVQTKQQVSDDNGKTWKDNGKMSVNVPGGYVTSLCNSVTKYVPGLVAGKVYKLTVTAEEV